MTGGAAWGGGGQRTSRNDTNVMGKRARHTSSDAVLTSAVLGARTAQNVGQSGGGGSDVGGSNGKAHIAGGPAASANGRARKIQRTGRATHTHTHMNTHKNAANVHLLTIKDRGEGWLVGRGGALTKRLNLSANTGKDQGEGAETPACVPFLGARVRVRTQLGEEASDVLFNATVAAYLPPALEGGGKVQALWRVMFDHPYITPQVCMHVYMGCGVLQCVAVCCSVLQCVAVCRSVLQCVAVCCSVL